MTSAKGKTSGGNAKPASPYSQLEAPGASSTGLTGEQRRAIFLNKEAFRGNADIQKNISEFGCDLSLVEFPEWQRTKHVHRLHPYLGKFIPQLVELFLRRFFAPGQMILDPFAGSGTTLVAAEKAARRALAIEISPRFCDMAVRRWEILTGKKAARLNP